MHPYPGAHSASLWLSRAFRARGRWCARCATDRLRGIPGGGVLGAPFRQFLLRLSHSKMLANRRSLNWRQEFKVVALNAALIGVVKAPQVLLHVQVYARLGHRVSSIDHAPPGLEQAFLELSSLLLPRGRVSDDGSDGLNLVRFALGAHQPLPRKQKALPVAELLTITKWELSRAKASIRHGRLVLGRAQGRRRQYGLGSLCTAGPTALPMLTRTLPTLRILKI